MMATQTPTDPLSPAALDQPSTAPSSSYIPSPTAPYLPDTADPAQNLAALLNRLLRITIRDHRYFIGRFTCTDSALNIVLSQAEEFRPAPKTEEEKRWRENQDMYFPRSQRGEYEPNHAGWAKRGDGYGEERPGREGRMLSMIMIPGREVVSIELIDEAMMKQEGEGEEQAIAIDDQVD